jgi:hypothetical protein
MDVNSLSITDQAILYNLAWEDGHQSPEQWLNSHGYFVLDNTAILYFRGVDNLRHIYQGENQLDVGRRINCYRIGCKDIRGPNLLPRG